VRVSKCAPNNKKEAVIYGKLFQSSALWKSFFYWGMQPGKFNSVVKAYYFCGQ
jgi:hypothetical protein